MWLIRALYRAVVAFVRKFVCQDRDVSMAMYQTVLWPVDGAVYQAVGEAVDQAVGWALYRSLYWAVPWTVHQAGSLAVYVTVDRAVHRDPSHPALDDFLIAASKRAP